MCPDIDLDLNSSIFLVGGTWDRSWGGQLASARATSGSTGYLI